MGLGGLKEKNEMWPIVSLVTLRPEHKWMPIPSALAAFILDCTPEAGHNMLEYLTGS